MFVAKGGVEEIWVLGTQEYDVAAYCPFVGIIIRYQSRGSAGFDWIVKIKLRKQRGNTLTFFMLQQKQVLLSQMCSCHLITR